jgi:hypothetical protein
LSTEVNLSKLLEDSSIECSTSIPSEPALLSAVAHKAALTYLIAWRSSQFLDIASIPEDEVRYGETQYLQITAISPELDLSAPVFANQNLPQYVLSYYEENDVNTFSFTSPLTAESTLKDPSSVWTEKTVSRTLILLARDYTDHRPPLRS